MIIKQNLFICLFILIFSGNVFAAFPESFNQLKDITQSDKTISMANNIVTVSYSRPAKPLIPFTITFTFFKDNIKSLSYSTNMMMNMGNYKPVPKQISDNTYAVSLTLPKCGSGRTLWYGQLAVTYIDGTADNVIFFYNVK